MALYSGTCQLILPDNTCAEIYGLGSVTARLTYVELSGYNCNLRLQYSTAAGANAAGTPTVFQPWDPNDPPSMLRMATLWTTRPSSGSTFLYTGYSLGAVGIWFPRGLTITPTCSVIAYQTSPFSNECLNAFAEE